MINYAAIGRRTREARKAHGLTQEQLASLAGISPAFVGHIERGTRILSIETLYSLCGALNVSADFLLGLSAEGAVKGFSDGLTASEREHIKQALQAVIDSI